MAETESTPIEMLNSAFRFLRRRRWWIGLSMAGVALMTLAALSRIPNRYNSEATLLVVQQQVPQRYVTPTAATDMREALEATTQEVLSRTRLLGIIDDFNLYPKKRHKLSPEGLLDVMRKDIDIKPLESHSEKKDLNAFKISFTSEDPVLAQRVTDRLTSLFVEESLKARERQSTTTTNFLQEQLAAAKKKLADQEERLRNFKMQNLGELPEQQQGNLTILAGFQSQLQNTAAALSRAQQQKVYLESMISGYRGMVARRISSPSGSTMPSSSGRVTLIESEEENLIHLQSERSRLAALYTSNHPDLVAVNQKITQTEEMLGKLKTARAAEIARQQAREAAGGPANKDDDAGEDPQIKAQLEQVKSQLEANRVEVTNLQKDEKQLKSSIAQYQSRLNLTPVREQQLAGILRDYDLLKQDYTDLLSKEMQSQLAANLEKRQEGQQFRLVDKPSLPTVPASPARTKFSIMGIAGGLVFGIGLAYLQEFRNPTFHSEMDVSKVYSMPFIIGVPVLLTPAEKSWGRWKLFFEWSAGSALLLIVAAAEVYVFLQQRHG